MNIGIDIDDTLTNSFDYFQRYVAEYFNVSSDYLKGKNISYSNLPNVWKNKELDFFKAYYDKVVPFTPFKEYAREALNKLKEAGHRIVIITARTKAFYQDPYKTTVDELNIGNISYDKLVCSTNKAEACKEEKIDLFIDDIVENVESVKKLGIEVLLFTSKENELKKTSLNRVNNWHEVIEIVTKKYKG